MPAPKKASPLPKPTASELDLLRLLWQSGPATARQVHEAALQENPDSAFATVLRTLQIMHAKGLLIRDESERAHVYAAAHAQEALQTNMVKELIHKAFSGSAKNLVMAALRGNISQAEKDEIQRFLDQDKK